ncbi:cytochrome P450 [Lentinus tigrinus ALCF2SS1-7]|uniref:Cytochrome P450 n=1 Tax=Lentinus tigrinus ALCF2SS1-6 TaxID=1328759 RepID=A0A5C2RWJ6_9APHY|nr:cytochrome P450 [Lentinus tigrinus ALCF2SS1-6]RPD76767.1 cytochrome P450 [Lentinus tigrinus ALCF2SS1-7]
MAAFSLGDLAAVALCAAVLGIVWRHHARVRRSRLPPGPPPLPILGNILDVPRENSARAYQPLFDKYGDVVYLDAVKYTIIVLGSYTAATELLDKRSTTYSGRPGFEMVDLIGGDWVIAYSGYTDFWRQRRKRFRDFFSASAIRSYQYAQEAGAQRLAQLLLSAPGEFADNVQFIFGSTVFSSVYGIDVSSPSNEYLVMAEDVMNVIKEVFTPGRFFVEVFPVLRRIPAWVPGMGFKRKAAVWAGMLLETRNKPFDTAAESVRRGDCAPCVVATVLDKIATQPQTQEFEEALTRDVCGNAYLAAVETVTATVLTFVYTMALYPEVQQRAQAEIDAVVGHSRFPLLSDRPALPYIDALLNECLRWMPTAQLGVPHASVEDDEYKGYFIPKGSIILVNVWGIARSKEHYVEPDRFMPERFLTKDGQLNKDILSPRAYVFGFGRRICPGMHFGDASLFITIASVLHALTIKPTLDENGKPNIPSAENVNMKEGFLTHPEVPGYIFEARSHAP